jgi:hypothetical protein
MEEFNSTTNFHTNWLDNLYNQLMAIQTMFRNASEGANELMDYLQIPINQRQLVIPEVQYKNLRFLILEMDLLLDNLYRMNEIDIPKIKEELSSVKKEIDNVELFLQPKFANNQLIGLKLKPAFKITLDYLSEIKTKIINVASPLLYLPEGKKPQW